METTLKSKTLKGTTTIVVAGLVGAVGLRPTLSDCELLSAEGSAGAIDAIVDRVIDGDANTALAHATSGPCLQQNLVCVLEAE